MELGQQYNDCTQSIVDLHGASVVLPLGSTTTSRKTVKIKRRTNNCRCDQLSTATAAATSPANAVCFRTATQINIGNSDTDRVILKVTLSVTS